MPFGAVLRSEWTKLWSVRSTWWCTAVYLLVVGASGWLAAAGTDSSARADIAVQTALTGFGFGQLVLVVLGVLVGDHRVRLRPGAGVADRGAAAQPAAAGEDARRPGVLAAAQRAAGGGLRARRADADRGARRGAPDRSRRAAHAWACRWPRPGLVGVLGGRPGRGAAVDRRCRRHRRWRWSSWRRRRSPWPAAGSPRSGLAGRCPRCGWGRTPSSPSPRRGRSGMGVVAAWAVGVWLLGAVLLERRDV